MTLVKWGYSRNQNDSKFVNTWEKKIKCRIWGPIWKHDKNANNIMLYWCIFEPIKFHLNLELEIMFYTNNNRELLWNFQTSF